MGSAIDMCQLEEIKGYRSLEKLALDFIWLWNRNHAADKVWEHLDPKLWELTRNPWAILQTVSREKLEKMLADPNFYNLIMDLVKASEKDEKTLGWYQQVHSDSPVSCIAYFSMEYMLSESLPIYSGGLGNVAGDQLKAASDLGVPVIGIGLLYQQGYFRQIIEQDGSQKALYPYNSPGQLPIRPLRKANGEWLRLEIPLPGWSVWLRAWEVIVGRVKLYLLDSNDPANYPPHRGITSELYGGNSELRFKQELILGMAGWRLLEELGIKPQVCHLNEGHAAFAVLERAKYFMMETGASFQVALHATRAGNVFTTHTAVTAGFDRFPPLYLEQYLGGYAQAQLGISVQELLALGRQDPSNSLESFNMAYLAIRGSGSVNGVSVLHEEVSQGLLKPLFPRWPQNEVPVGHVTNGVHMPSWSSIEAGELWADSCGKNCWQGGEGIEARLRKVSDEKLWQVRNDSRKVLIDYCRTRLARMVEARGATPKEVENARQVFDPNVLTLGFARRFATYKRPNLLLYDQERLIRILTNPAHPVQLILAGKAHPADKPGQLLIQEWIRFIQRPEVRSHIIFLEDYDMLVSEHLVRGVDLWINNPRRPWEACGTSGMKVLVNGGINLSVLDGWWAEAYTPEIGWALGDGEEHGDDPLLDAAEANKLYELLENQVVPEFYARDKECIPKAWLSRIRESMAQLTPRFSADRAVREYTEKYYLPAGQKYLNRTANKGALAKQEVEWQNILKKEWSALRFGDISVQKEGEAYKFDVQIYLNDLNVNTVKVELYAEGVKGSKPVIQEMTRVKELSGAIKTFLYQTSVVSNRPAEDFTPRVVPYFPGISIPLEAPQVLWGDSCVRYID